MVMGKRYVHFSIVRGTGLSKRGRGRVLPEGVLEASSPIVRTGPIARPDYGRPSRARLAWARLLRIISVSHILALADQVVVSGASFLTMILVARWTDAAHLGIFAIAISVLAVPIAIQHSLVVQPYMIRRHDQRRSAGERASCALIQTAILSVAGFLLLTAAAQSLSAFGGPPEVRQTAWAVAALLPLVMGKELVRNLAFADLHAGRALGLDMAAASIQLAALAGLVWTGRMSLLAVFVVIGASCALVTAAVLYLTRATFAFHLRSFRPLLEESWNIGKWLSVSRLAFLVQGYATYWLVGAVAGATMTGIYAACMNVVGLANPLILGLYNVLAPKSVLAWKESGAAGLRRSTVNDALLLAGLMSLFCLFIFFTGETAMQLFYGGGEYQGYGNIIDVLALATLVAAAGLPASNALASIERVGWGAAVSGTSAVLHVGLVFWLMTKWGLLGATFGMLVANSIWTLARWTAILRLVPRVEQDRVKIDREPVATCVPK
jgi:O-antigen/teichoic acid export membrane protein